jgi:hypothetical protein
MNNSCLRLPRGGAVLAVIVSCFLLTGTAKAQNYYFDPGLTATGTGSGADTALNTWDTSTPDWYLPGTGDTTFPASGNAIFDGAAGAVSVSEPVSAAYLEVGVTSGIENIGTTGADASEISFAAPGNTTTPVQIDSGTEDVNFNSGLNLNLTLPTYSNTFLKSYTSGNVAFNGGIMFTDAVPPGHSDGPGEPYLQLNAETAGGSFTINSAVTGVNTVAGTSPYANGNEPRIDFEATGPGNTLTLTSNASFTDSTLQIDSGTTLDQGVAYNAGAGVQVNGTAQYLTDADNVNVAPNIQLTGASATVGGALADNTSYSGIIINYASNAAINLTAAAGGTVTFSNSVEFNGGQNDVINKIGAGVVKMTYTENGPPDFRTYAGNTEIKNGTLLLDASNALSVGGTTLMVDEVLPTAISATQTYATLGGEGNFLGTVVAAGPHSVIAPGDPGVIGTLTLNGLTANNGVTLDFKLNGGDTEGFGVTNDFMVVGALTLNGPVTVNFESLGSVTTGTPYFLMTGGSEAWTAGSDLSFTFNTPAGYVLDPSYGTDGYKFSTAAQSGPSFSVEFEAAVVPEPSTYAMLLGGLAFLGFLVRRKAALLS